MKDWRVAPKAVSSAPLRHGSSLSRGGIMTSLAAAQFLFRLEPVIPIAAMSAPAQLIQLVRALGNVVSFARFMMRLQSSSWSVSEQRATCVRRDVINELRVTLS